MRTLSSLDQVSVSKVSRPRYHDFEPTGIMLVRLSDEWGSCLMPDTVQVDTVSLGYGPDAIDAFKYYAIREDKISTEGLEFDFKVEEILELNDQARQGRLDATGLSFHAYAYLSDKYNLFSCGGSVGKGHGPVIVGRYDMTPEELADARVAVPGRKTTAHLVFQLYTGERVTCEVVSPTEMLDRVLEGEFDAGILIHEDLVTYQRSNLVTIQDLGEWWERETGLPLPVGSMAVRQNVEPADAIGRVLKQSIQYAMDNWNEALEYAARHADQLSGDQLETFIRYYVNDYALDYGRTGRDAIRTLFSRSYDQGLLPDPVSPVFVQID